MSMTRWDPFRDMLSLREAMNQLLESSYIRPGTAGGGTEGRGGVQSLALDVAEREGAYLVTASLPGVKPEDVDVSVLGDTLTIRAETKGEQERQSGGYLLRERHAGVMQRSVTLPNTIDAEGVAADFEDGVLTLTLPKSRASMPRRIEVRTAGRLPSLEAQTPGLDVQQEEQTARDAQAFFSREGDQEGPSHGGAQSQPAAGSGPSGTPQPS